MTKKFPILFAAFGIVAGCASNPDDVDAASFERDNRRDARLGEARAEDRSVGSEPINGAGDEQPRDDIPAATNVALGEERVSRENAASIEQTEQARGFEGSQPVRNDKLSGIDCISMHYSFERASKHEMIHRYNLKNLCDHALVIAWQIEGQDSEQTSLLTGGDTQVIGCIEPADCTSNRLVTLAVVPYFAR